MTTPGSYCSKKGLWIFPPVVAVAAIAIILSPVASATANSDFFQCLTNHNVSWADDATMLDMGIRIQNDLRRGMPVPVIERNVEKNWDVQPSIARIDVMCAGATLMLGNSN